MLTRSKIAPSDDKHSRMMDDGTGHGIQLVRASQVVSLWAPHEVVSLQPPSQPRAIPASGTPACSGLSPSSSAAVFPDSTFRNPALI